MPLLRRVVAPTVLLVAGVTVLSGCSFGALDVRAGAVHQDSSASITVTPAPTGQPVSPSAPLVVKVAQGRLTDVVVTGPLGAVVGGLSVDGRTWTSQSGSLDYNATYKVSARAVDRIGLPTDLASTITTVAPSAFLGFSVSPSQGDTVGVGMPLKVDLDTKLGTDAAKAAFEKRLTVLVNGAAGTGAWHWMSDDVVEYRPPSYWPGHATITLKAAMKGVRISKGLWGETNKTFSFRTGASRILYVDMNTHQMKVTQDGVLLRTIPITTGKAGFESRSGVKVIIGKERTRIMDAATGGTDPNDPEYYRLEVEYAMRLTYTGEFLHAAPWSVRHQGHENVSHGCTGMSTANAAWLYSTSSIGDVVVYSAGHRVMETSNGIGIWNMSFARWSKGSALT